MEKGKKTRPPLPQEEVEVPVQGVPIEDWYDPTGGDMEPGGKASRSAAPERAAAAGWLLVKSLG